MATDLAAQAADKIFESIRNGTFAPDKALLPEAALAEYLGISRLTMREGVKALTARGVLTAIQGKGTFVVPFDEWTDLDAVISITAAQLSPHDLGIKLIEVRRMIEVGAAGLAAVCRTEAQLDRMSELLGQYEDAHNRDAIDEATEIDMNFHKLIAEASGNPFLPVILRSLEEPLHKVRAGTSAKRAIRERALGHHAAIFAAIKAGDATEAKETMRAHMTQTRQDIDTCF